MIRNQHLVSLILCKVVLFCIFCPGFWACRGVKTGRFSMWKNLEKDSDSKLPDTKQDCETHGKCGPFGICNAQESPVCSCVTAFQPKTLEDWNKGNFTGGCVRTVPLQCDRSNSAPDEREKDGFLRQKNIKIPDFGDRHSGQEYECHSQCEKNCSCIAYSHDPGIGCLFWSGDLINMQRSSGFASPDFYVRVAYSALDHKRSIKTLVIAMVVAGLVILSIGTFFLWKKMAKKRGKRSNLEPGESRPTGDVFSQIDFEELLLFSFEVLANATEQFHDSNRLGQGGFGPVYKGRLADEKEIAVKRLSAASGQGLEEFMNEVVVISKLQHRNLVKLLGCCVDKKEKMLVYEFMPNKSLDVVLFDTSQSILDWRRRFSIIEGIGRGLLYLHRDSRLRIIHRDLKLSNVLLDDDWNPKISDFGMARIFGGKQVHANTRRVVGTYGYMAPEYAAGGRFSEKSDVFSFGVMMLEIISGRKNTSFYNHKTSLSLLGFAWKLWNEDNAVALIDARISSSTPSCQVEIIRCIQIGLLCVQEYLQDRPTISTVLSMLCSEIPNLPNPKQSAFAEKWTRVNNYASSSGSQKNNSNEASFTVLQGR